MSTPEGAGNDAAPLAAGLSENGRRQPAAPESTSEPPSAGADSAPAGAAIDIE
ncbi:AarF/ABC1/UbiB kinase family protein, partial [Clostridioides difficile]|nr:AarF/ABC1/UbiB kinase family protein [Clostridioides difficile]